MCYYFYVLDEELSFSDVVSLGFRLGKRNGGEIFFRKVGRGGGREGRKGRRGKESWRREKFRG